MQHKVKETVSTMKCSHQLSQLSIIMMQAVLWLNLTWLSDIKTATPVNI